MKKQLIIKVTQHDIDNGKRRSPNCCPIALSMQRRTGQNVEVDFETVRFGHHRGFPITRKMEIWMSEFDAGLPVEPTAFFVDYAL